MAKLFETRAVETRKAHWVEWLTGVVSAALIVALIGWIAFEAVTQDRGPPDLSVSIINIERRAGGYLVMFAANNTAGRTAAGVVIRGEVTAGGRVIETVETTLDYVPMRSSARGGFIFRNAPEGRSRLFATGFSEP
ncbi:TIGR02588 family protein [Ensifer adhaerens]|uniref:TIGR02588 family protein n=1 Tax=Ensifer adhaerens TaxID=106592 RepID=UPI003D093011